MSAGWLSTSPGVILPFGADKGVERSQHLDHLLIGELRVGFEEDCFNCACLWVHDSFTVWFDPKMNATRDNPMSAGLSGEFIYFKTLPKLTQQSFVPSIDRSGEAGTPLQFHFGKCTDYYPKFNPDSTRLR